MGENSLPPKDGLENGHSPDKSEPIEEEMEEGDDDLDEMSPEEFQAINNQLDALNSALDDIEEKNDNIHARLLQLLQSNKEIRQQIGSEQSSQENLQPESSP